MAANPKVALGGILTECNHFGGLPIELETFQAHELFYGQQLMECNTSVVGGMLAALRKEHAQVAPLIYASACPGGPISAECYRRLRGELLERLRQTLPVDGVLLPLHGSALAEDVDDPEGDILQAVREIVGPQTPVVATLDLHAHVTAEMVHCADALLAWETYPHRDQYNTGKRGARLLLNTIQRQCRPTMAMGKVPVITSAVRGSTDGDDPFAELMREVKSLENREGVLSSSLFLVHPYMDVANMGSGAMVITDNDLDQAMTLAGEMAQRYWERRHDLEPQVVSPRQAINRGLAIDGGPIILVETADCCGGGAAGDSIATLSALVDNAAGEASLASVVDPEAALRCHRTFEGAEISLELGHKFDPRWGRSCLFKGVVRRLSDGQFTYTGGQWEGVAAQMGLSAVFVIGAIHLLIISRATYDWSDEQFRAVDLDPAKAKFVVAKNPMNHRLAYGSIAKEMIVLDTPGPTPATIKNLSFQKLQRPFFPVDDDIPDLKPAILA